MIFLDEADMVRKFIRDFTLRIKEVVFVMDQSTASLQRVVESTKEFKLIHYKEYEDIRDKRSHTSVNSVVPHLYVEVHS